METVPLPDCPFSPFKKFPFLFSTFNFSDLFLILEKLTHAPGKKCQQYKLLHNEMKPPHY